MLTGWFLEWSSSRCYRPEEGASRMRITLLPGSTSWWPREKHALEKILKKNQADSLFTIALLKEGRHHFTNSCVKWPPRLILTLRNTKNKYATTAEKSRKWTTGTSAKNIFWDITAWFSKTADRFDIIPDNTYTIAELRFSRITPNELTHSMARTGFKATVKRCSEKT